MILSRSIGTLLFTSLLLPLLASDAHAQFTFNALDGLPTATTAAEGSLGEEAELMLIGTPGSFDFQGFPLRFDLESGESMVWLYLFRGATSGELYALAVARLILYQTLELGAIPLPIPGDVIGALDHSGDYADSDAMIAQLEKDATFQEYRGELPNAAPTLVTLTQLIEVDSLNLPNGFPIGQATWTLNFMGSGDSTMTCFVASETGETYCQRITGIPTSVDEEGAAGSEHRIGVAPNPARGSVRITLGAVGRDARMMIVDTRGETVADLTASLRSNGGRFAELEAGALPAGAYRCLLIGSTGTDDVGLIIVE